LKAPEAPGWYPDPNHEGRMRRWDGSRWTGESRSLPPWANRPAGGRRRIPPHWLVFGAVALFMLLLTSYKALTARPNLPKRTVFDTAFIAQANATCKTQLTPLKTARPKPGSKEGKDPGTEEQVASQVDGVAASLHSLAQDLRAIPVASASQAAVSGWLSDWDSYTAIGHNYADAVRRQTSSQQKLVDDGARVGQRADLFAEANKLNDCMFS
jgi:hypothetical protein